MILLFPTLINFENAEDRKNFDITYVTLYLELHASLIFDSYSCHMFYPRRVLDINDGKPKWSGINGSSELIADTPEETKKRKREDDEKKQKEEKEEKDN